ncbi:SDR family oxidoreductase [Streptomyces sp. DH12]|uniref:SDR family oxidoreductase n=1 Tax=Streptomyces sp. DH12 TaxID=2857010 RepID=UPI001E63A177|nr:SDR family oxidoreductase [Streptomyces sp. DH12]
MTRVVVTGGGTGIGRATARLFARDGAEVVLVGRRAEVLEEAAAELEPAAVRVVAADLAGTDGARLVLEALDSLGDGSVDVLVNNAGGVDRDKRPGLDGYADSFRRTLAANLLSAAVLTEALWPRLARPGGRVVSVGSIAARRGGADGYTAAKAGLIGWSQGLARRGGPEGISVNTVVPGYVQDTGFFGPAGRSVRHDTLVAETLLGRAGVPGDIAPLIHFLASPGAAWITGQAFDVNGGSVLGR